MSRIILDKQTLPYRVVPRPNRAITSPIVFCAVEVGFFNPYPTNPEFMLFHDTFDLLKHYAGVDQPGGSTDFHAQRMAGVGVWVITPKKDAFPPMDTTTYSIRIDPMKAHRNSYRLEDVLGMLEETVSNGKRKL